MTRRAVALIGHKAYIRWCSSPFNDAAEFGDGGFDGGVFIIQSITNDVVMLISGPSYKDIRLEDIVEIIEV